MAMQMVRGGDRNGINLSLMLVKHDAEIPVKTGLWVELTCIHSLPNAAVIVHITECHDLSPGGGYIGNIPSSLATDPNTANLESLIGPPYMCGHKLERKCSGGTCF
tara:strand:+ start:856 stop:1173 length:318 start_codon:yes stop_codon:yes gene_type:complete